MNKFAIFFISLFITGSVQGKAVFPDLDLDLDLEPIPDHESCDQSINGQFCDNNPPEAVASQASSVCERILTDDDVPPTDSEFFLQKQTFEYDESDEFNEFDAINEPYGLNRTRFVFEHGFSFHPLIVFKTGLVSRNDTNEDSKKTSIVLSYPCNGDASTEDNVVITSVTVIAYVYAVSEAVAASVVGGGLKKNFIQIKISAAEVDSFKYELIVRGFFKDDRTTEGSKPEGSSTEEWDHVYDY